VDQSVFPRSSCTMSADGADFKMPMKVLTTNIVAAAQRLPSTTVSSLSLNDGNISAVIIKAIERAMAAEYSRELSAKVFAGQSRLTELGFRQGGTAGYGFRRLLVDHRGNPKFVLEPGERKSIATDRIILIPGPPEEIEIVNEIFRLYTVGRFSSTKIAEAPNKRGVPCEAGRPWTRHIIRRLVTNPKHIGANVSNRQSAKLRSRRVNNPPDMWIRRDNAFQGIVDPDLFRKTEAEADDRTRLYTDEDQLDHLNAITSQARQAL
jgi:hypothetical protein